MKLPWDIERNGRLDLSSSSHSSVNEDQQQAGCSSNSSDGDEGNVVRKKLIIQETNNEIFNRICVHSPKDLNIKVVLKKFLVC